MSKDDMKNRRSEFTSKNMNIFAGIVLFNSLTMYLIIKGTIPEWLGLIIFISSFVLMYGEMKSVVVINNNELYYRGMILKGKTDLNKVSKLVTRKQGTYKTDLIDQRGLRMGQKELILYLLDDKDNVILSFPQSMIVLEERSEFIEQIKIANQKIIFD